MAESNAAEKTLAIKITPKLDVDALTKQIKEALAKAGWKLPVDAKDNSGQATGGTPQSSPTGAKTDDDEDGSENKNKTVAAIRAVGSIAKIGFDVAQQTFNGIFGIIKEIHARVKQSSAFLAAVENLFNLAVTLLLMPLGNAIAEVILPRTVELVEGIVGLWEDFGNYTGKEGLKGIISVVMDKGLSLIGDYLKDLGNIFIDTDDKLLSSIGSLFNTLGNWLENGKIAEILDTLFGIFHTFAAHLDMWIPMIIGYQMAQLGATIGAASAGILGEIPGIGGLTALLGAGIAGGSGFAISYAYLNSADGGEIPQTAGGQLVRVAEHESEVIMPKSKLQGMGGNTYYYTVNGYTTEEVKQLIRDFISSEISNSQYRSGL